jgi:putative ABC transport system ATP-binding protein
MAITVNGLTKTYKSRKNPPVHALRGIDVSFPNGSMTAIMGPSGCGKTTFLNLLAGIDLPTAGSILLGDVEITKCSDVMRSKIRNSSVGYVMQSFELIETMDVKENLSLPLLFSSAKVSDKRVRVKESLDMVGMGGYEQRLVSRLSGGQKQRIAIARALMMKPSTILADEPTGSLDSQTANEIMSLLAELNEMGRSIILVTHDLKIAQRCLAQYTMIDGKLRM